MSVPVLIIADAIVTALNEATLSLSFKATREYVPKFDTTDANNVQVKVVPKSDAREMGSAAVDDAAVAIDIGVMKRLQNAVTDEKAELDALLELCEEIKAVINRERLTGAEEAVCVGVAQEIVYSVEDVDQGRVFLTVITANFATTVAI